MSVSGNVSAWLNLSVAVLSVLVAGGPHMFPDYVPAVCANGIVQTAAFVLALSCGANAYLHQAGGLGVSAPGVKALALILATVFVLGASNARAADNPLNAIGAWASADVDAAIKAATLYPNVQDQTGAVCLGEIKTLATMLKDHPLPVTLRLATDIEYARLAVGELNRLCRVPACAQVWSDMSASVKALAIIPLPLSFASICARVPIVGLSTSGS